MTYSLILSVHYVVPFNISKLYVDKHLLILNVRTYLFLDLMLPLNMFLFLFLCLTGRINFIAPLESQWSTDFKPSRGDQLSIRWEQYILLGVYDSTFSVSVCRHLIMVFYYIVFFKYLCGTIFLYGPEESNNVHRGSGLRPYHNGFVLGLESNYNTYSSVCSELLGSKLPFQIKNGFQVVKMIDNDFTVKDRGQ